MSLIPKSRCLLVTILVSVLATLPLSPSHAGGLTAAHSYQEDSEIGSWAREFMTCLKNRAGIYVELIGKGRLGSASELLQAVQSHQIDIAVLPVALVARALPSLGLLAVPGAVNNPADRGYSLVRSPVERAALLV